MVRSKHYPRTSSDKRQAYRLMERHARQIAGRPDGFHAELCRTFALTFQPGDGTPTFIGKTRRPLGCADMAVLSYEFEDLGAGRIRRSMPFRGYSAEPAGGRSIRYGGSASRKYLYDGMRRPSWGAGRVVLDPHHNAVLVDLLHAMDCACEQRVPKVDSLSAIPRLPQILLGFSPEVPPTYEDTPALRELAAQQLHVPIDRLGANGPELLDCLLRDLWEQAVIPADARANSTGHVLISAELCTQSHRALRIYEDFSHLLGVQTWNPARDVVPQQLANPAKEILSRFHIDLGQDFEQPLTDELVEKLERAMRSFIGPAAQMLSQVEIFDGLVTPDQPLTAWTEALPRLRARLNRYFSECATDLDLLRAAKDPAGPLVASGACRVQVLKIRRGLAGNAFVFSPSELRRNVSLDLQIDHEPAVRYDRLALTELVPVGAE